MSEPYETEYLRFVQAETPGRKTDVWKIFSVNHGDLLGEVKWFGRWRQYAFFPADGTVWNEACMQDVRKHIVVLMQVRRVSRA